MDFDKDDLQMTYNKLFMKFVKLKKNYKISLKNIIDVEHEKESLVIKLSKSHALIDFLKSRNTMLTGNLGASTSHPSNSERKTLFVKLMKVEEIKANIACLNSTLLQRYKLMPSLFLHATIVGLFVTLDQIVLN